MTKKASSRYGYIQPVAPVAGDQAAPKKSTGDRRATGQQKNQNTQQGASVPVQNRAAEQSPAGGAAAALRDPEQFRLPAPQRGRAAAEGVERRGDVERDQLNVRIRRELKRATAGLAGLKGLTLGDLVEDALVAYIKQTQEQG